MARGALATAAGGQQVAAVLGRSPGGLVEVKGRGKKGERVSGNLFPTSIWAGAQRGGRSTAAGGERQR